MRFNWNRMAELDAPGYIARRPGSAMPRWDKAEFLASGRAIVEACAARVRELGGELRGRSALDFGCGVGRMSAALLERYEEYVGVDVAEAMLARTRDFASSPRAAFVHSPRGDLAPLGGRRFDLVWSYVTLQHVPPDDAERLLVELAASVSEGGWLCAQVPVRSASDLERVFGRSTWKGRLRSAVPLAWLERWREWRNDGPRCDMFGLSPELVTTTLRAAGLELRGSDVVDDTLGLVESRRYFATRPAASAVR
ncbi:MAG: class I SAM-dependent methyltransferase [Planctomycetes bacterium]|nr:class I SAM-dependent methyltransferase [Planctomycetota bacterium]